MADITVKRLDEMARGSGGAFGSAFVLARASLGVTSFGLQVLDMPAGLEGPAHAHEGMTGRLAALANDGQEEVYVALEGRALLLADGEEIALEPGVMVRCGPGVMRQLVTRESAARVLAIGAVPHGGYHAPGFTELPR
jgi:quercetin dioxygenase-like cupin family protein